MLPISTKSRQNWIPDETGRAGVRVVLDGAKSKPSPRRGPAWQIATVK